MFEFACHRRRPGTASSNSGGHTLAPEFSIARSSNAMPHHLMRGNSMISNSRIEYKSEFSNLVYELAQSIIIQENPEKSWELDFFLLFDLKMVDLATLL